VLRVGAIGLDALRAVVPDLDTSAVEPVPARDGDARAEAEPVAEAAAEAADGPEPDVEPAAGTGSEAAR
jgi:hypothetical protein